VHGIWNYFTVDDGQVDLANDSYLLVGTLESYRKVQAYYGLEQVIPIYVEVEDGLRLSRAVERERAQREPKYAELCRRFLADEADFSEEKLSEAGIVKRFQNDDLERCLQEIFREITKLEGDE
jgi:guanylate kinase